MPGLTYVELRSLESLLDTDLPDSFKELYQWRNGQSSWLEDRFHTGNYPDGLAGLVFDWLWMSIDDIVYTMQVRNKLLADKTGVFTKKNWWNPKWIPFLTDYSTYWCLDMAGSFGGKTGQILVCYDDGKRTVVHRNFDKWLKTALAIMESGLNTENSTIEEYEVCYAKINPGYPLEYMAG
jgi:cell wall assembly regulator SMI1